MALTGRGANTGTERPPMTNRGRLDRFAMGGNQLFLMGMAVAMNAGTALVHSTLALETLDAANKRLINDALLSVSDRRRCA